MPLSHLEHNGCILHDYAYTVAEKKIDWTNSNIFLKKSSYLPNTSSLKIVKILIRKASAGSEEAYL